MNTAMLDWHDQHGGRAPEGQPAPPTLQERMHAALVAINQHARPSNAGEHDDRYPEESRLERDAWQQVDAVLAEAQA